MDKLVEKRCQPCEGGVPPLSHDNIKKFLEQISNWELDDNNKIISKKYNFKNFYQTMNFVNAVAWIANKENHHPDLEIGYNYCIVHFTTHAIKGLSENDFICAAKVENLMK